MTSTEMRLFECVLFLVMLPRMSVSLSCYKCSDIDSLHKCQTVVNCGPEQVCYTRSKTISDILTFTMGCTEKKQNYFTDKCLNSYKTVHGGWTGWSNWGACTVTCDTGIKKRFRNCTDPYPERNGNHCFGESVDVNVCIQEPCASVDGGWTDWGNWSSCSASCDGGLRTRSRSCSNPFPDRHGRPCDGDTMQVETCNKKACAVDGGWTDWGNWSSCSASCDGGLRTRSRSCSNPFPDRHGRPYDGDTMQVEMCNKKACSQSSVVFSVNNVTDLYPDKGQTIIFSKVPTNEGGGYNNATGVFTTPRNGTYIFYAHICVRNSRNMHFDIMVDNVPYATAYGFAYNSCECPFAQAVAQLGRNVSVYVQWKTWTNHEVCQKKGSSNPYFVNYFSGLLITE